MDVRMYILTFEYWFTRQQGTVSQPQYLGIFVKNILFSISLPFGMLSFFIKIWNITKEITTEPIAQQMVLSYSIYKFKSLGKVICYFLLHFSHFLYDARVEAKSNKKLIYHKDKTERLSKNSLLNYAKRK